MSEERKTKTDAAAPASAALGRIDRKDAFLQALHTFLTAHQGTEWAVAAVDIQHFKLYNELYGTEKGDALLETVANCLLGYSSRPAILWAILEMMTFSCACRTKKPSRPPCLPRCRRVWLPADRMSPSLW